MRAGKTILMMFLLPALLVLFMGILLGYLSLNSLRQQQLQGSAALALDLATIHQEAGFNRDIAQLHSRVIDVLDRSEEHTSELQSRPHLVCRLLLEKKKKKNN